MTVTPAALPPAPTTMFGTWNEPAIVCIAGDVGSGKSKDATLFDPLGWTFALPGSIKAAHAWMTPEMYDVAQKLVIPVTMLPQVVEYVELMAAGKMEARTVRIDDLSVLVRSYVAFLDTQFSKSNTFGKWNALAAMAIRFRDACKKLPVHTIIGAHLAQPRNTPERGHEKGGPDCGGRQAMEAIVPILDVMYRVEVDHTAWPWPSVYKCSNPDPDWHTKDRHGVVLGSGPMNLREIFRVAGMHLPRYPGFAWMDDVAEAVAVEALAAKDAAAKRAILERHYASLTGQNVPAGVAYWSVVDGLDRATLAGRQTLFSRAMANTVGVAAPGVSLIPLLPAGSPVK